MQRVNALHQQAVAVRPQRERPHPHALPAPEVEHRHLRLAPRAQIRHVAQQAVEVDQTRVVHVAVDDLGRVQVVVQRCAQWDRSGTSVGPN